MNIREYLEFVRETDRLPKDDLSAVLHGLFGEVGGIMVAAKKLKREPDTFLGFNKVVIEEFGDAFWYLCCLAGRLKVDVSKLFLELTEDAQNKPEVIVGRGSASFSLSYVPTLDGDFDKALVKLGQLTGDFLSTEFILENSSQKVFAFLEVFIELLGLCRIDFLLVLNTNIDKVSSRFIRPQNADLPNFDLEYSEIERLPDRFEVEFVQRTVNQQAMRINGVFIGDPLTDSIGKVDDYKFHDVFHFANAAILHWSPTFRALLKHKRKSTPDIEEAQDGGRAIVVEEGLTAWIFAVAKENEFFEKRDSLTFDMLKNIGQFVQGYEVEKCPLILWEESILKGFEVFRQVKDNGGGVVIGDRLARTIEFNKKGSIV